VGSDVAKRLNFYLPHYQAAFACSLILYPYHLRLILRFAFPDGSETGLPRSAFITEQVRSSLFAGGHSVHDRGSVSFCPDRIPFGPSHQAP
jgi:hypothetical protein